MPRYFFDLHDGELHSHTEGQECASLEDVRTEAMHALPQVASGRIPHDGDRQAFTLIARDEEKNLIYTATLTYAGVWVDAFS